MSIPTDGSTVRVGYVRPDPTIRYFIYIRKSEPASSLLVALSEDSDKVTIMTSPFGEQADDPLTIITEHGRELLAIGIGEVVFRSGDLESGEPHLQAVIRAIREGGLAELVGSAGDISPNAAFLLGLRAGAAAMREQISFPHGIDGAVPTRGENDTEVPPIASWQSVLTFAHEQGYDPGLTTRLRKRLSPDFVIEVSAISCFADKEEVLGLLGELWVHDPERPDDWRSGATYLNLNVAKTLVAEMVGAKGYAGQRKSPTIKGLGLQTLSLFADYLNQTMALPDDERFPLYMSPKNGADAI